MQGLDALSLTPGDYRITPSERVRNWTDHLGDLLSGDTEAFEGDGFHVYDVERETGETALEIHQRKESDHLQLGISIPAQRDVSVFRTPDGTAQFALRSSLVRGWVGSFTLTDGTNGEPLATMDKSGLVRRRLQLAAPGGQVQATADRERSLGTIASSDSKFTLRGTTGDALASLTIGRAGGGLTSVGLREMDVSITPGPTPPEIVLAYAFAVFLDHTESSSSTSGGGGVD
jgi:hypothetical protein